MSGITALWALYLIAAWTIVTVIKALLILTRLAMHSEKDVEKSYPTKEVVAKLRRLADALEAEKTFEIQIAGERIYVPPYATVEFEYERDGEEEELEIEVKWKQR